MGEAGSAASSLVEIVPNFSEGRRTEVIEAILAALRVPGVRMLTWQADPDHNRLDATLVGSPEAVRRSAMAGAATAARLIDMDQHQGNHPRMGAVDVIPFLPVRGISMQECIDLARDVAREIGETLGIPVYAYDQAALVPERRSLADVRKGEYEGLKADVAKGERLPDFGPAQIGSAGAVAVGARKPLVAFNVYLDGTDEAAAKAVARAARESTGGLKNVRAIGFFVEERDCVTVSMNLVDVEATPIHRALELVRSEAARFGLHVTDTEIVGMAPELALIGAAGHYLQLKGFDPDEQVLERVLAAGADEAEPVAVPPGPPEPAAIQPAPASVSGETVGGFLDGLASAEPTPGGGTAAALTGAAGAALVAMVARLTAGKKGFEPLEGRMREIEQAAEDAREAFARLADRDAEAFDQVMRAFRMPKETDQQKAARHEAIQRGLTGAAQVPLETARAAVGLMEAAREVTAQGNPSAASDGAAAAELLAAACRAAVRNVQINAASITDEWLKGGLASDASSLLARADELLAATGEAFASRLP